MKLISFSIFKDCPDTEFNWYLRGLYWNARMAKLIYPDWLFHVEVSKDILTPDVRKYLAELHNFFDVYWEINEPAPRCVMMLWRLKRLWDGSIDALICRDADSITTYKESQIVNYWLNKTTALACGINDNKAHNGTKLMGGLCGFRKGAFKEKSFADFIRGHDLTKHGSDQKLINMKYQGSIFMNDGFVHSNDNKLWESNLIPAFMGSAGINEMEALRFFKRHDPVDYSEFEKQFPNLFYWWL